MDEYVFKFIDKFDREATGTAYAKTMADARDSFVQEQGDWCKRIISISNLTELRKCLFEQEEAK